VDLVTDPFLLRLAAAIAAIAPGALLLAYFSYSPAWRDIRELTWIAFGLGFTAAIPIAGVASLFAPNFSAIDDLRLYAIGVAFLEASLPEELGKFLVIFYFLLRHEDVRRPLDVVTLSIVVSLGFASIENIYYVFGSDDWSGTAMIRAVTAIPMHSTMGIIMGYYGARCLIAPQTKRRSLLLMFLWPAVLHGFYDYPVFAVQRLYEDVQDLGEAEALEFQIIFILAIFVTGLVAVHAARSLAKTPAFLAALPLAGYGAGGVAARDTSGGGD
jgi:RsiW-degrading membrane proteinase PrsW (M82 family)